MGSSGSVKRHTSTDDAPLPTLLSCNLTLLGQDKRLKQRQKTAVPGLYALKDDILKDVSKDPDDEAYVGSSTTSINSDANRTHRSSTTINSDANRTYRSTTS